MASPLPTFWGEYKNWSVNMEINSEIEVIGVLTPPPLPD